MRPVAVMTLNEVRSCKICGAIINKGDWHFIDVDGYQSPPKDTYPTHCKACSQPTKE